MLILILLVVLMTRGSNKLLNIWIGLLEGDDSNIQRDEFLTLLVSFPPGSSHRYSYANIIVFGKDWFIISKSWKKAIVNAFNEQVGTITFPIFGNAVVYDYPWSQTTYILIARNILSVPSMDHNLISTFILSESGLTVNDTAMIHLNELYVDDHAIIYPNSDLRTPLHIHGTFSYFSTRMSTPDRILYTPSGVFSTN